jgi:hypothetical protein
MHRLFIALLMIFPSPRELWPRHTARALPSPRKRQRRHTDRSIPSHTPVPAPAAKIVFCAGSDRLCYIVCLGTATWLAPEQAGTATDIVAAIWPLPGTPNLDGLGPGRNERPPNDGLAESHRLPARTPI